ncbi:MAG: hypothetical protein M3483_06030 [Gemmatimonadota bacterium]|jgi:hypothetical protein|nr:hypothetical protein [Gemmatimonadota bacterium]
MASKQKKPKRSTAEMHRQVQDSLQALPYAMDDHARNGRRTKALVLRYLGGPLLRAVNGLLNRSRYRGTQGAKLKQAEQMKRHLQQREQARKYVQGEMHKAQKTARRGKPR